MMVVMMMMMRMMIVMITMAFPILDIVAMGPVVHRLVLRHKFAWDVLGHKCALSNVWCEFLTCFCYLLSHAGVLNLFGLLLYCFIDQNLSSFRCVLGFPDVLGGRPTDPRKSRFPISGPQDLQ